MDGMLRRILLLLLVICSFTLHAGIVITGTRVIYPASSFEVSVNLTNKGQRDALVQSWIDSGDPMMAPEKIVAPFVVIPPLVRVNKGKGQSLRILFTGGELPVDRESIFWLNVLTVPPKVKNGSFSQANYLNVAFQNRIKIFYRPQNLNMTSEIAPSKLQWSKIENRLQVENPTPYHISLIEIIGFDDDKTYFLTGEMVTPFGTIIIPESKNTPLQNVRKLTYGIINDQGVVKYFSAQL